MYAIFLKEVNAFLSSVVGYVAMAVFLILIALFMWVFPDYSVLNAPYATMDPLFEMAPVVFLFLIPAITMRMLSEEFQSGAIELLVTHPVSSWQILLGKFWAAMVLLVIALTPTVVYYATIYYLGDPPGNLDSGAIAGSYIGLLLLGATFVAIGLFASSLTANQIVAFLMGLLLCFVMHYAFGFISNMPVFVGVLDNIVMSLGVEDHYRSISRGVVDTRDLLYFMTVVVVFLVAAHWQLERRRW